MMTFCVFAVAPISALYYRPTETAAKETQMEFLDQSRSPAYRYQGDQDFKVYQNSSAGMQVVGQCRIPTRVKKVLLLFTPTPPRDASEFKYTISVVDDSAVALPGGSFGVINVSGSTFSGLFGSQKVQVAAEKIGPFDATSSKHIKFTGEFNGEKFPAAVHDLQLSSVERAWVVLFPPSRSGQMRPQLRILYDRVIEKSAVPKK